MTEEKKKTWRRSRVGRINKPQTSTLRFTVADAIADPEQKIYRPINRIFRNNVVWYTRIAHGLKMELSEAVNIAYLKTYENLLARDDKSEPIGIAYVVACAYFHLINEVRRMTHSGRDKAVASIDEMIEKNEGKENVAATATYDTDRTSYRELVALIQRELEECPIRPESRDRLRALFFEGKSAVEIARENGVTRQAVHEVAHVFRKHLVAKYGGKNEIWNLFMQGVGES